MQHIYIYLWNIANTMLKKLTPRVKYISQYVNIEIIICKKINILYVYL